MSVQKVIVVIGASGGLGRAIARAFFTEENQVVLAARSKSTLEALADFKTMMHEVDIVDMASVSTLRDAVLERYGRVDVVVNATGYDVRKPFELHTPEEMRRTLDVNLLGAMQVTYAFLQGMTEGVIVHLGGFADGRLAFPYYAADVASRAGVASFVEALNRELRLEGKQVRLMYFSPSPADTEAERPFHALWRQMGTRIVSPEQVAAELRRAIFQKKERHIMGGALVRLFAQLNAAFPKLADALLMNGYGRQLRNYFSSVTLDETKTSFAMKAGMTLVIFSFLLYGVIFSLPWLPLTLASKLTLTPALMGVSEAAFWIGGILAGKEVVNRYRRWLDPRAWCSPKEKIA